MIEAELKARVSEPGILRDRLRMMAAEEASTYTDTYYDWPGRDLTAAGRELRVRVIETGGSRRCLLTWKEPAVDAASGSKPEHETAVADPAVIDHMLRALGLAHVVRFQKRCVNYRFTARNRDMFATIVTIPELDGTFIELETLTPPAGLDAALSDVRTVLRDLGITNEQLTTELYTDAVIRARSPTTLPDRS